MNYEFQSTLYRTAAEMCYGIASAWVSAGGLNSRQDMLKILFNPDEALADQCIHEWGLAAEVDEYGDDGEPRRVTWMEKRGVERADIVAGFSALRAAFDDEFPADASYTVFDVEDTRHYESGLSLQEATKLFWSRNGGSVRDYSDARYQIVNDADFSAITSGEEEYAYVPVKPDGWKS